MNNLGLEPYGGVVFDNAGNLYGTTSHGGYGGIGNVYRLVALRIGLDRTVSPSIWKGDDGAIPIGGLIINASGNLYGTTIVGLAMAARSSRSRPPTAVGPSTRFTTSPLAADCAARKTSWSWMRLVISTAQPGVAAPTDMGRFQADSLERRLDIHFARTISPVAAMEQSRSAISFSTLTATCTGRHPKAAEDRIPTPAIMAAVSSGRLRRNSGLSRESSTLSATALAADLSTGHQQLAVNRTYLGLTFTTVRFCGGSSGWVSMKSVI